jgi:hypothetical protein
VIISAINLDHTKYVYEKGTRARRAAAPLLPSILLISADVDVESALRCTRQFNHSVVRALEFPHLILSADMLQGATLSTIPS